MLPMAKRRTRKQKIGAKHTFKTKKPEVKTDASQPPVKRQFSLKAKVIPSLKPDLKKAKGTAKDPGLSTIRHDIVRSLILASLVLSLEIMIYLIWSN